MKKTSRRTFAKQIAGSLAALPLGSVLVTAQRSGESKTAALMTDQDKKNEHNTPPPLYFMEGSLVIEAFTDRDDWSANDHDGANRRRKWSIVPRPYEHLPNMPPSNLYIEHVKVVDGAGEMVFRLDNDTDKSPIEMKLTLKKGGVEFGDCLITVAGNHYEINLPETKRIKKKGGDPPSNSRRKRIRYMHESGSNADECEWVGLRIAKGRQEVFNNPDLRTLPAYREMRLMIWWTNFPT